MLYKTLFNINLYHAYFLDEGSRKFHDLQRTGNILSENDKKRILTEYDSNNFLEIVPIKSTTKKIEDYRLILKKHTKGIRVFTEALRVTSFENGSAVERYNPLIKFPEGLTLSFYIKSSDRYFNNYSKVIGKNKPQLYFLSNKISSAANVFDANNEMKEFNGFLASEKDTRKLIYELEKENQLTNANANFSVANIDETVINTIEIKIGEGEPLNTKEKEILERLNAQVKRIRENKILGILQLETAGISNQSLVENVQVRNLDTYEYEEKQCILKNHASFDIAIENRKTFWRYHEPSKNIVRITKEKKPLTQNGTIIIKYEDVIPKPNRNERYYFPNPTSSSIKKENEEYYSEIFI